MSWTITYSRRSLGFFTSATAHRQRRNHLQGVFFLDSLGIPGSLRSRYRRKS